MFGFHRHIIHKNERGLLLRNGGFERLLEPGEYRLFDPGQKYSVERYPFGQPAFEHPLAEYFMVHEPELVAREFKAVRLAHNEVGLVLEDGVLVGILPPGTRRLYWKDLQSVQIETLTLTDDLRVPAELLATLGQDNLRARPISGLEGMLRVEVAEAHVGLLYVDGLLRETLPPGAHGFWCFHHTLDVTHIDMRARLLELNGQEIMTRDKIVLRLNATAVWRYADPEHAFRMLPSPARRLYTELQFALRSIIATHTLSALLEDRSLLDQALTDTVAPRMAPKGIVLESTGVKDLIMPREIRMLLKRVTEAELDAEANLIRRREETAAMRALLNTARVLEGNPVALRLKEMETLERIVHDIDTIKVNTELGHSLSDIFRLR